MTSVRGKRCRWEEKRGKSVKATRLFVVAVSFRRKGDGREERVAERRGGEGVMVVQF